MRVERFDYALPPELIAQEPAPTREAARLLIVADPIGHATVGDLAEHVAPGTLVVVNDTRVIPARVIGTKEGSGGRAEVFLVRRLDDGSDPAIQRWRVMARASKAIREGARIVKDALVITFEARAENLFDVRLEAREGSLEDAMKGAGRVPLPPYIRREARPDDVDRYQTIFAKVPGAVAAPTAGLHLTADLLGRLASRGCVVETCTLHVGLGTFQPVTVDDLDDHPMHAEWLEVSPALVSAIAAARERGASVLAVGTTVVRALESAADPDRDGHIRAMTGETRLLVQPGYRFRVVDRLLTNFHLPKSTLLALVAAFAGTERVLDAYKTAIAERYRFFSYGDAMLLDNPERRR